MLKDPGRWLKECWRALFSLLWEPQTQKPPQTLQIGVNGGGQKALPSDAASRDSEMAEEIFSSSYCQTYFEHLVNRALDFRVLNAKGPFKLMLEHVFVEPNMALALPFTKPATSPDDTTRCPPVSIWEFLATHHALMILGPPGSGKTSLLLHITQTLTEALKQSDHHAPNKLPNKLPILLFLHHYSDIINKNPNYTLVEAVQYSHNTSHMADPLQANWFEKALKLGQCLVMLDGLNEVPERLRQGVVMWLKRQMENYGKNDFVVTSRLVGYRHSLRHMMVLEIQPFSNEQVQRFVERWYLATQIKGKESHFRTRHKVQELSQLCFEPALSFLVVNPLLLTMMTTALRYNASLPRSRVDLYSENIELFLSLGRYGQEFNLTSAQMQQVLQPLAYYMMEHNRIEIGFNEAQQLLYVPLDMVSRNPKVSKFLQMIAKESGLLRESGGKYRFAHLSAQEYLAGLHLKERSRPDELVKRVVSSWWHETIRVSSMQSDATEIIAACLSQKNSLPALQLAIRCAQEAPQVKPEVVHQLESVLALEADATSPVRRRIVADALLAWSLKRMMRVHENLYVADSLITNTEYRLFIEEQRVGNPHSDEQFKKAFLAGSGQKAVTDVQASDAVAFCQWLTERNQSGFCYRLPYSGEFSPLMSEMAYWTQKKTEKAYELEKEQRVELSLKTLENRLRSLIARDIVHNLDSALARLSELDHALEKTFNRQSKHHRACALALARDFVHDRAHDRLLNQSQKAGHLEDSASYTHFVAWLVTQKLLTLLREQPKPRSWLNAFDLHGIIVPPSQQKVLAEGYFELYTDLANLEERSLGKLLTAGGIRIVAERTTGREGYERKVHQKKICLLGNEGVGKTSLVRRFVKGSFDKKYQSTMGVSISRKTVERPTYTMNMLIWDIEGGKGFKKMQLDYLRSASGALIVCDLARSETLAAFERYARQLRTLNPTVPIVFVGNKIDLNDREVTGEDMELLGTTLDAPYLLASAKTGTQVEDAFSLLADLIERR